MEIEKMEWKKNRKKIADKTIHGAVTKCKTSQKWNFNHKQWKVLHQTRSGKRGLLERLIVLPKFWLNLRWWKSWASGEGRSGKWYPLWEIVVWRMAMENQNQAVAKWQLETSTPKNNGPAVIDLFIWNGRIYANSKRVSSCCEEKSTRPGVNHSFACSSLY